MIVSKKVKMKKMGNKTMAPTQPQSHLTTPITKKGLFYGRNVIATIK